MENKKSLMRKILPIGITLVGMYAVNMLWNGYLIEVASKRLSRNPTYITAQQEVLNLGPKRVDSCVAEIVLKDVINNNEFPMRYKGIRLTKEMLLKEKEEASKECAYAKDKIKTIWETARNDPEVSSLQEYIYEHYSRMLNPFRWKF